MTGQTARDTALATVADRNPLFKERALARLAEMRKGHLRTRYHDRAFLWEEILPDVEYLVGFKIPHHNLSGAIVMDAIRSGIIEETGRPWRHTTGEIKHSRKACEYRWALYA